MKQKKAVCDIDIRDALFDALYNLASKDRNVIFLTADMGALSLDRFKKDIPDQYINVGISEQNLISVAAGLALGGKKVYVYAISSFITQRCYEQIRVDLCGMGLPVTIIGSGPGITYSSDGYTHHAVEDIAIMRVLPGISIFSPCDVSSASAAVKSSYKGSGPVYIRLDKGKPPLLYDKDEDFSDGLALVKKGRDLLIIATGIMVHQAIKIADTLAKYSIQTGVMDLYRIKPVNEELLLRYADQSKRIITLEEHSIIGGIGSAVSELLAGKGRSLQVDRYAIADMSCSKYGDREWMHRYYELDIQSICEKITGSK